MRELFLTISIAIITLSSLSFVYRVDKVQWYEWEEAIKLSKAQDKKIMVFVHADDSNWCEQMENETFNDNYISAYINENYIPVKFNAQFSETITYKDKQYNYVKQGTGGYHEFVAALTGGRMVYPTSVFLDHEGRVLQSIQGYQKPDVFEMILTFFGEDHHRKTPWKRYVKDYNHKTTPIYISDDK